MNTDTIRLIRKSPTEPWHFLAEDKPGVEIEPLRSDWQAQVIAIETLPSGQQLGLLGVKEIAPGEWVPA